MNTENAIASPHDEIVFDNRNKEYGAYTIRRAYDSNLSKGTFGSFLFVGCLFGMAYAAMMLKTEITKVIADPITHPFIDIVIVPDQPPVQAKRQLPRTSANTFPTKVVTDNPIEEPQVTTTATTVGEPNGADVDVSSGENIEGPVTVTVAEVAPPPTLNIAEVMPEFAGGEKALYKFLRKTLKYPQVAKNIGEEGTVYVRFIIDVTGTVTGIEVIKGVSAALDKEALRVISLMPRWKPGMQHGSPVNVRKILPIKFEFNRE